MAAGNLVVTSDAVGNRFYCDFGDNCLLTDFQSMDGHINAINWAIDNWNTEAFVMRQKAHDRARDLGLDGEYEKFGRFLQSI